MMRHAAPFGQRYLGRGDLSLAVDLNGIAIDNLSIRADGDFNRQRTLARRSRTNHSNNWGIETNFGAHPLKTERRKTTTATNKSSNKAPMTCPGENFKTKI